MGLWAVNKRIKLKSDFKSFKNLKLICISSHESQVEIQILFDVIVCFHVS